MQHEQASRTALLIAASLVLLHHDAIYSRLVSKTSADLCAYVLEKHSAQMRLFLKIVRQPWCRPIARLVECLTIPGILLHYALRKKCIRELVRSALANGIAQVVILGAGFDPRSSELQGEFPTARFWEIDRPATPRPNPPNFLAQATDLLRSNRTTLIYGIVRLIEKVLSAIQRISGPEAKVRSKLSDFKAIGVAIIGSFSQADEFMCRVERSAPTKCEA